VNPDTDKYDQVCNGLFCWMLSSGKKMGKLKLFLSRCFYILDIGTVQQNAQVPVLELTVHVIID
jgi:hypothetical protein